MPRFIDVHHDGAKGMTPEVVARYHQMDLEVQDKYGVRFMKYWFDPVTGKAFCLSDAPSREAVLAVHRDSHGYLAD
jgi:hypothetical protein